MVASILVALIFMVLFGVGLSFMPLVNRKTGETKTKESHTFNDNIEEGEGPFPLIIALIIIGTFAWGLFYILYYGFSEVKL